MRAPRLTPLAAALLHVPVPERALAIESGDGEAALLIAREFPAARVRGAGSSPALVREASSRVGLDPEGRVAFKPVERGGLPYPDGFFDLVAGVDVSLVAGEIARVMRPGAHLILARSRPPGLAAVAREKLWRRRLVRLGLVAVDSARVGAGNFFVGRLGEADEQPRSN
jgi:SAM-dependent methyltransferase